MDKFGRGTAHFSRTKTSDRANEIRAARGLNPFSAYLAPASNFGQPPSSIRIVYSRRTAREIINRIDEISFNSAKAFDTLGGSSKVNNKRAFFEHLRKIGWTAAKHGLEANVRFVGERSTVDLSGLLPLQDGLFKDPIGIRQLLQTLDQIIRGITH